MKIYAATTNRGKLAEFAACAGGDGVEVLPLPGLAGMAAPVEDADSFMGNAALKAVAYSRMAAGLMVFADDSGLEVDALGGMPGVRSARFAEDVEQRAEAGESTPPFRQECERMGHPGSLLGHPGSSLGHAGAAAAGSPGDGDARNNACLVKMLRELGGEGSAGRFRCALVLAREGEVLLRAEGVVEGEVLLEPRGADGFGYDPLFLLPGCGLTMAEVPREEKWRVGHRGKAFREMLRLLKASTR